jgi:hypothetical protein
MTRSKKYFYTYHIMEEMPDGSVGQLITDYDSNLPPPQTGSFIDLGELMDKGIMEYRVIKVTTILKKAPATTYPFDIVDHALVIVLARKVKDPLEDDY